MQRELAAASIPIQARIASDWTRVARATRQIPREKWGRQIGGRFALFANPFLA